MPEPAVRLYPYQRRWIGDKSRFKLGKFARQTGKTFSTTLEIAIDLLKAAEDRREELWTLLGSGQRQTNEMMRTMEKHLRAMGEAAKLEFEDWGTFEDQRIVQGAIELRGGARAYGLPANPMTARGYSGNVYLDEFAFHRDPRAIWAAAFPMVTRGRRRMVVTSTPAGKGGMWYELDTSARATAWSRHAVDIHAAIADGYPADADELQEGVMDDDTWRREYLLEYIDEASAWFTHDLISGVEHDGAGDPEDYAGGRCFMGVDVARRRHLWCATVFEEVGDVLWSRELVARRNITFAEQEDIVAGLFDRYHIVRSCWDRTGMGEQLVERAQGKYGSSRVEGVQFTPARQADMATEAKRRFEDRTIRLPRGDRPLRADLHSLRQVQSSSGAARFVADKEDTDGHADRAWSIILACAAADVGAHVYEYQGVRRFSGGDEDEDADEEVPGEMVRSRNGGHLWRGTVV